MFCSWTMAENGPSPPRLAPRVNALSSPLSRFFTSSTRVDPRALQSKSFRAYVSCVCERRAASSSSLLGPSVLYFVLQSLYSTLYCRVQCRQELSSSQQSHTRNPSVSVQSTLSHSQSVAEKVRMVRWSADKSSAGPGRTPMPGNNLRPSQTR
jgi:hypothetical protein